MIDAIGPRVGFAVVWNDQGPRLFALELRATSPTPACLPSTRPSNSRPRPLLVLSALEHNKQKQDTVEAALETADGRRIHRLVGSKNWPSVLEPSFAVTGDWLLAATHPGPIRQALQPRTDVTRRSGLVLEWNVAATVHRLASPPPWLEKADPKALLFLRDASSLASSIQLSTAVENDIRRWTLYLAPAK